MYRQHLLDRCGVVRQTEVQEGTRKRPPPRPTEFRYNERAAGPSPPGQPSFRFLARFSGREYGAAMGQGAAFFDLDRTLLRGASGPAIGAALRQAGVLPARSVPGEALLYKVFDLIGETLPSMALARQAATYAAGWSVDAVVAAAEAAADVLT